MDRRKQRGLEIAAKFKLIRRGKKWFVPSQSGKGKYTVDLSSKSPSCTCPDFKKHQVKCKHIWAVWFRSQTEQNRGKETPAIDTSDLKKPKRTYPQKWPEYNKAQVNEKDQFQILLYELCRGIEEPIQTFGRPRMPISDLIFGAALKVYSTVSGRRCSCDIQESQKKGYLSKAPHYNTIFKYLERADLTPHLRDLIVKSSLPLKTVETEFAPDSSGFSTGQSVTWYNAKYGREVDNRDWIKVHIVTGVKTNIVTSVEISGRHANDGPFFKALLKATAKHFNIVEVSADKAYSTRANLRLVESLKATPYIAFKENAKAGSECDVWNKAFHYYSLNQEKFFDYYHKRSNVESTFSMIKRKFGERIRSKTDVAQVNEALCKILCHNICCVIQSMYELGIEPNFEFGT